MTFNRLKYKRTADVDTLVYHGGDNPLNKKKSLSDTSSKLDRKQMWTYVELIDYSGDSQSMRQGDKFNLFQLFSLVYHHNAYINYEVWEFHRQRPIVYLNISYCFSIVSS